MVYKKVSKRLYTTDSIIKDEFREMLVASANYPYSLSSQEDNYTELSYEKIMSSGTPTTKRKRRLDNLTADEKILRKKLKNREAAQTSRDKKKAYVNNLEITIKKLRAENERLQKRVLQLNTEKDELKMKNDKLEEIISQSVANVDSTEPAALYNAPLQWDLLILHSTVLLILPQLLITTYLKNLLWIWMILIGLIMLQIHPILRNWKRLPTLCQKKLINWRLKCPREKLWWSPRQKSWTPPLQLLLKLQHHLT